MLLKQIKDNDTAIPKNVTTVVSSILLGSPKQA